MGISIYTSEEITEMADTWANFSGFSGETCGNCRKTANVFALGAGWFCDCGHYNVQSYSHSNRPWKNPDMGTPRDVIAKGFKNSTKYQAILKG